MRDGVEPWRTGDLVYLEREINYWAGPKGYLACTAGVAEARAHAGKYHMDRVAVLPAWAAHYDGVLQDIVAKIDPQGLVADCSGAKIVVMSSDRNLDLFVEWCRQNVRWT